MCVCVDQMGMCRRWVAAVALVCALGVLVVAAENGGSTDCCAVRHVPARQPRFCGFSPDALMCSADGAGAECRAINNFGIGVGAGFARDYVALAQEDAGCTDKLLAFHCAQRCGDCVRSSSSAVFVRRRACLESVLLPSSHTSTPPPAAAVLSQPHSAALANRTYEALRAACPTLAAHPVYNTTIVPNISTLLPRASGLCVEIPAANPKHAPLAMGILGLWVAVIVVVVALAPLADRYAWHSRKTD